MLDISEEVHGWTRRLIDVLGLDDLTGGQCMNPTGRAGGNVGEALY